MRAEMSKVHMISAEQPITHWQGSRIALCGKAVLEARPVLTINLQDASIESVSTISCCPICLPLALAPVYRRTWIYGLLPAEQALKVNRNEEEA